jgi:RNA polymerase sigma-70 factor, ECF subfamily
MHSTETLWIEFHDRLRQFVARRVSNPADVDDIVQDVFLRIHQKIDTLHQQHRLHAWVYQITRNAIVDYYRSPLRRREAPLPESLKQRMVDDEPLDEGVLAEMSGCVAPILATLSARNREALVLTEINGMTQIDAARKLGVTHSGMKSRVQRARRQVRDALLDCCQIDIDRRGGIIGFESHNASCDCCVECQQASYP